MRNHIVKLCLICSLFCCSPIDAQTANDFDVMDEAPEGAPVEVYGSANLGDGKRDSVLLKQQNDENPLGNQIVLPLVTPNEDVSSQNLSRETPSQFVPTNVVQENLLQNPKISQKETPQIVNKQIQNTLYYSGGRIYDVQSYPATDIDYIERPNLNKTITTYPAY